MHDGDVTGADSVEVVEEVPVGEFRGGGEGGGGPVPGLARGQVGEGGGVGAGGGDEEAIGEADVG